MKEWFSKTPPLYIWPGDVWVKEPTGERFYPDFTRKVWIERATETGIPFHKNTKIFPADELSR